MHKVSSGERLFAVISLFFYGGALIPLFQHDSSAEATNTDGNIVGQGIYILTYLVTIYYSLNYLQLLKTALWQNKGLLLLFCLAFASICWSDDPEITGRRAFSLIGSSLFGYYLSIRYSLTDILRIISQSLLIGGVLSAAVAIFLPSYGVMSAMQEGGYHEGAWKGIYSHKNTLGRLMVISTLTAYALYSTTREKQHWLTISLSLLLIVMSRSSSALVLVAFVIGFSNILKAFRLKGPGLVLMLMTLLLLLGSAGFYLTANYELLFEYLGKDPTLTGRTLLWDHILAAVDKRPLTGHGFGGFWLGGRSESAIISQELNWDIPNAHNGFLDLLLDLGYVGLTIFLLSFLGCLFNFMKQLSLYRQFTYSWGVTYSLLFIAYNFLESNALRQNSLLWIVLIATISAYSLHKSISKRILAKPITAIPTITTNYPKNAVTAQ